MTEFSRRILLGAASAAIASPSIAQDAWPSRPVRVLVGYPAGGANDIVARAVSQGMQEILGQPVTVENRAGGAGSIAAEHVARAAPDGTTLYMMSSAQVLAPALRRNLNYDPVRDFTPLALGAVGSYFLAVHHSVPATNVQEFIALARRSPGSVNYASSGVGAGPHLSMELLATMAGIRMNHVPYRGDADALIDLTAGRVQAYMSAIAPTLPHIRAGTLRALAVTGAARVPIAPDVPTIAESGLAGYDMVAWWGLVGPANLPPAIAQRAEAAATQTIRSATYRQRFEALGFTPGTVAGADFARLIATDVGRLQEIVRRVGIQPE